ncbi:polysaccharide biosynthesis/export family protein [Flavobacterium paronense]|uniref:Polysaccharide biosynthesis/export family protein n=1 Tax=Flavobacterium paronense TaxID=1392775 RepID=A0ABV5GFX2_9FLAO|nr:polysaccharide biosynthesis/export family protein [Flavobacterium paronense]MDN3676638.1 polysaccharide biosynthesis/export family protein [Flavobacterium paronense]
MNKTKIYLLLLLSVIVTSCIPKKDLIYLQDKKSAVNEVVTPLNQNPYRLQTNDILNITIKAIDSKLVSIFNGSQGAGVGSSSEQGSYFSGYYVDDHGNIRLPILGEMNVLGFTTEEVRVKIEKMLLDKYFKEEAGIYVVVKLSGFKYTINGEVGNTGTKTLYQEKVNIMEAIANSGDINITGDRKDVKVIRRFPNGNETFSIDLTDANAVKSPAFNLQPNDYILVNPLKQKTWGTGKTGIESLTTIITLLSLATTTFLLLRN